MGFQRKSPLWYDAEYRYLRGLAIRAGARLAHATGTTDTDNNNDSDELIDKSTRYRACKHRKRRAFKIAQIDNTCDRSSPEIWKILDFSRTIPNHMNPPSCEQLADYFEKLSIFATILICRMKLTPLNISRVFMQVA